MKQMRKVTRMGPNVAGVIGTGPRRGLFLNMLK
jgi:Na+-transporting methylmalonyl-CoA/oxaloacetate decarboxylase beta subunit